MTCQKRRAEHSVTLKRDRTPATIYPTTGGVTRTAAHSTCLKCPGEIPLLAPDQTIVE
jgi:hypothetical protein